MTCNDSEVKELQELEALVAGHDFYYDYSDDHSVWKKGIEKQKVIDALSKKCNNLGYEQEVSEIIKKCL